MKKALRFTRKTLAVLSLLAVVVAASADAANTLVRFKGGIGVIPVSSAAGTQNANGTFPDVNRNDVRGVPPGGQPWVIADLRADVKVDGRIRVDGRGLLLGGGNNIGANGGASVFATLFCANDGNAQHSSNLAGVPLEADGDFRIDDVLAPAPPTPCDVPVLLIRTTNGGRWFAAGIPER
ncbi:MAG TPA: hypothetical protein VLH58_00960 [Candidatus Methylomirabilis sp.]|nr:hypothetical protein [Candidatus Methylomirabilis sp.]HSC69889.1 hypothetical protein [Candidatus Methylomirabilis sp.]